MVAITGGGITILNCAMTFAFFLACLGKIQGSRQKSPCRFKYRQELSPYADFSGLFVSFIVNNTFCNLLDVQQVFEVDVVGEVVAAVAAAAEGK